MHAGFTTIAGSSTPRWRIISVRELSPEEKGDKHHVFINLRDQAGADARGTTSVKSGWEGMTEAPIITPTDKPANEPACNVPIFEDQKLWVEVAAGTAGSDRASGMDCFHAYEVVFQYDDGISQLPDPAAHLRIEPAHEPTRGEPETTTTIQDPTAWTPPITFLQPEQPDPMYPNRPTQPDPCEDLIAPDLLPESEPTNA